MGIRGLNLFLKKKNARTYRSLNWGASEFRGQRWGVDIQCLLHRARGDGLSPLTVIAALIVRLRYLQVEPVFVFDGRPPAAKEEVISTRRTVRQAVQHEMEAISAKITTGAHTDVECISMQARMDVLQKKAPQVSYGERDDVKRLLRAAGVLYVTASGEADDVLAFQCRTGYLQAVISTDMDMLARGVQYLIIPETPDASIMTIVSLSSVLAELKLSYDQFVEACVLMGCDYTDKKWTPLAPAIAITAVSSGSIHDIAGAEQLVTAVALLRGNEAVWENLLSAKQREKWTAGASAVDREEIANICKMKPWPADWQTVLGKL